MGTDSRRRHADTAAREQSIPRAHDALRRGTRLHALMLPLMAQDSMRLPMRARLRALPRAALLPTTPRQAATAAVARRRGTRRCGGAAICWLIRRTAILLRCMSHHFLR